MIYMLIVQGHEKTLKKLRGTKSKKTKKSNQWFYCDHCPALIFFRVFKGQYDWSAMTLCEMCLNPMQKAPNKLCANAKQLYPHHRCRNLSWYETYLSGPLWKIIRSRVLDRDGKVCQRCASMASVVHHRSYADDVMLGNRDEMLVSLCRGCHDFIEFDGGRKTSLNEANQRLDSQ